MTAVTLPAGKPCLRAATRRAAMSMLIVACAVCTVGCSTFRRNPVAENVVSARQLSLRGMDAMQRNRWDEAEALFATAVETNPADERAHRRYAELLWRRGMRDQAIEHLEQSLRLSGGDPERLTQMGEMYLQQGDLDRAWWHTEEAIRTQRQLASAWALRGDILRRRQRLDDAMASYHRALSYQPHYPHVQVELAEVYREQGRARRALATLDALVEQYGAEPAPTYVLSLQGHALKSLRRFDEAVEVLTKARNQGEPSMDLLHALAEAQWHAGDEASAGLTIHTALTRDPYHEPCRQLRKRIQEHQRTLTASLGSGLDL
ncbi:MAG: tetratricopeptide repeat protein [Pirellulaceae bacterium]